MSSPLLLVPFEEEEPTNPGKTPGAHNDCWMVTGLKEILRLFELNEFYLQINKIVYTPPYNGGNNKNNNSDDDDDKWEDV